MQDFLTGRMPNPSISVKVLKEYDTKERKKHLNLLICIQNTAGLFLAL